VSRQRALRPALLFFLLYTGAAVLSCFETPSRPSQS
jgi:hypothetical protein